MQLDTFDTGLFLREYWQRKPLLIRNPWDQWRNPLEPDELAGLACESDVESRLIVRTGKTWALEHGPIAEARFGELGDRLWTLLVQAVDHHVPEVAALIAPFRFIPDWRIVGVSIAPDDGPADAQRRRALDLAYAAFLDGARTAEPPRLDLLTGDAAATARIARTVGFAYERGTAREAGRTTSSYAHPATVIVVTPDGRVARYFNGLDIDASQLRSALKQASGGGIGGLSDRIAVFCSHFDPLVGRYSSLVMDAMRVAHRKDGREIVVECLCKRDMAALLEPRRCRR